MQKVITRARTLFGATKPSEGAAPAGMLSDDDLLKQYGGK
jgi:hypothetical protein